MTYKNKKTGNIYIVENNNIINSTNKNNGERMVLYIPRNSTQFYIREYNEFMEKFENIDAYI